MTYAEAVKAGLLDEKEAQEYARELKRNALARFTSEELVEELKERSNRRVLDFNGRRHATGVAETREG